MLRPDQLRPHVYVCSRHPLAVQILTKIVTAHAILRDQIDMSNRLMIAECENRCQILVLDICSVEQWRDYAISWRSNGGRTIALLPCSSDRSSELNIVYLGIHGLVPISANLERELPEAMRAVAAGQIWMRPELLAEYARKSFDSARAPGIGSLTYREQQIVRLIEEELSNKAIAAALGISERTVKFHVSNILQKYHVKRRSSLILRSLKQPIQLTLLS